MGDEVLPAFAVIPTIGTGGYVKDLVLELERQGQAAGVFVIDNGCDSVLAGWLDDHNPQLVHRIEMHGAGIHEMWNAGLDAAAALARRCNVAILNDDIRIGGDFLAGLGSALRSAWNMAVVGPNYDGRPGSGVKTVSGICAGRYDGTGGLPGFAFMVRGESGYRFPTEMRWWFGDNDLIVTHLLTCRLLALVLDVTVEHVDGGSKSGDWSAGEMRQVLAADRAAFEAKWAGRCTLL